MQVLQSLISVFPLVRPYQLFLGYFCSKGLIKSYLLGEKKVSELKNVVPTLEVKLPKSLLLRMNYFAISKCLYPLNLI